MKENICIDSETETISKILLKKYIIPIYQRPYSWDAKNVYKLVDTILNEEGNIYLGNIMVEKSGIEEKTELRIVDGQQRITTLLMMLNYLDKNIYNSERVLNILKIESENESKKFQELMNSDNPNKIIDEIEEELNKINNFKRNRLNNVIEDLKASNIYKLNYYYIFIELKDKLKEIDEETKKKLVKKIENNIFVVNITINKSEGEKINTTKIFDTINTTGKPLETKDIFKIRMYDYVNKDSKNTVKKIDEIYKNINLKRQEIVLNDNKKREEIDEIYGKKFKNIANIQSEKFDVQDFLRTYKIFLIANRKKEEYQTKLIEMGYERFYDQLFEYLLNINSSKKQESEISDNIMDERKMFYGFAKSEKEECIKITDIVEILETTKKFKEFVIDKKWQQERAYFAYELFRKCNPYYWVYQVLPILFFYKFYSTTIETQFIAEFEKFINKLSDICIIYSITENKVIKELKTFLNNEIRILLKHEDDITNYTDKFIGRINVKMENKIKRLDEILKLNITNTQNKKSIICLIIARNAEKKHIKQDLIKKIELICSTNFHIEHIYSYQTNENNSKLDYEKENGIGNLMILEGNINTAIQDKSINDKIAKNAKSLTYDNSKYQIVKDTIKYFETNCNNNIDKYINNIDLKIQENICIIKQYFNDYNT